MSQIAGPTNGTNLSQDYQITAPARSVINPGIIGTGDLLVSTNSVASGEALILGTRTNGEKVLIHYKNTAALTIDTSGTKKVYLTVDQAKLDDGSSNSVDGTGIVSVSTGASYPASNYIAMASITDGAITDARETLSFKKVFRKGMTAKAVIITNASGTEIELTGTSGQVVSFDVDGDPVAIADPNAPMVGEMRLWSAKTAPATWMLCDGTAVSRSTYSALFTVLNPTVGTFTVTIATPGVFTLSAHWMLTGDSVYLTTTGALPTGLSANTRYWAIKNDANTFGLATSLANALTGTKIATTGSQSGTHTATLTPYGLGNGSTTFNVPDLRGKIPVGLNSSDTEFAGLGQTGGEKTHVLTTAEMPAHTHDIVMGTSSEASTLQTQKTANGGSSSTVQTGSAGSWTAHNNLQPYVVMNYIIKH